MKLKIIEEMKSLQSKIPNEEDKLILLNDQKELKTESALKIWK